MSALHALVAHQGGWDEILLIAGPIIVIAGLLVLAKKRVDEAAESRVESDVDEPDVAGSATD